MRLGELRDKTLGVCSDQKKLTCVAFQGPFIRIAKGTDFPKLTPSLNSSLHSPETIRGPLWVCNPKTGYRREYQKRKELRFGNVSDSPKSV